MTRINSNIQSLIGQRVLANNNSQLSTSIERLSTGVRINRGKDDPAGLIAANALKSDITAMNAAVNNAERADQVVSIAEGGLQEISGLLNELQGLVTASASTAGLSSSEKEANQLQIDSILQTIDRVSGSTNFQGIDLLNGNFDFQVSDVSSGVSDFRINSANFSGSSQSVDVVVTQSAQQGGLFLSVGGTGLTLGGANSSFTVEISGALGSRELQFGNGATLDSIASTINGLSSVTGVTASAATGGTGIALFSQNYGSNEFVSLTVSDDGGIGSAGGIGVYNFQAADGDALNTTIASTFANANNAIRDAGQDIAASINGVTARGRGRDISINSDTLSAQLTLTETQATQTGSITALNITGGGANFQLSGEVNLDGRVSVGIGDISTRKLGNSSLGFLDALKSGAAFDVTSASADSLTSAQSIIDAAIDQVSSTRGRLGAFQRNTIGATTRNLNVTIENTEAARSQIYDTDFAKETADLTRNQILVQASTSVLSIANSQPQNALSLLG